MAITNPARGATSNQLKQWWTDTYNVWRSNPSEFQAWANSNVNMATRWYALAQTKGQNLTTVDGKPVSKAELQDQQAAHMVSNGVDFKKDGALYTFNYGMVDDVNSEWGGGDFWKIGSYNTPRNGISGTLQNIMESPKALAMITASIMAPMLAPSLVSALGVSQAVASGIVNAGMSAVGGGDIKEVLAAGLSAYGMSEFVNRLPQIVGSFSPELGAEITRLTTASKPVTDAASGGRPSFGYGLLEGIGDAARSTQDNYGYNPRPPSVNQDMPILNPVVAVKPPVNPTPGGSSAPTGGASPATPEAPATPVPPAQPNAPQSPTEPSEGGLDTPTGGPTMWVVRNGQIYSRKDGQWVIDKSGIPEKYGVDKSKPGNYNDVGQKTDGTDRPLITDPMGTGLGGFANWQLWNKERQARNNQNGTPGGAGGTPGGTGGTPGGTGGTGPSTGVPGTPGGVPGTGTTPGTGTGTGTGAGNGSGTGTGEPPGFDIDWELLIPFLAPKPDNSPNLPQGKANPQDMSTRYQKPEYAPVEQKGLLEVDPRGLQAPPIIPADNSGQASFDQWYQKWLKDNKTAPGGLLPSVTSRGLV